MTPALLLALLSGTVGTGEDLSVEADFGEVVGLEGAPLQVRSRRRRGPVSRTSRAWDYFALSPY